MLALLCLMQTSCSSFGIHVLNNGQFLLFFPHLTARNVYKYFTMNNSINKYLCFIIFISLMYVIKGNPDLRDNKHSITITINI